MPKTILAAVQTESQEDYNIPIYLVTIALDSQTLRYTDNNTNVVFPTGGNTYTAIGMKFGRVKSTVTGEVDRVNFSFDNTDLTMSGYLSDEDFQGKTLTLKRVFSGFLDDASKATTIFSGEIGPLSINENSFSCTVLSPLHKLERNVPCRIFQANCPWAFGGTECAADTGELTSQTIDSGSTTTVIKDAARNEADDYWRNGIIEFTSGSLDGIKRTINSSDSSGGTITLINPLSAAPSAGDTYKIKRGCNKSSSACAGTFDNWANFGGFTAIPKG